MAVPKNTVEIVRDLIAALESGKSSEPVTPDDAGDLDAMRELFCGGAGTVHGWLREDDLGTAARPYPVAAGARLAYDFRRVSELTTATGLVAIR